MKTLICINTCRRSSAIKAMVWDYIKFVQSNPNYEFIVSLDGNDSETIDYCENFNIPLIYSEENEGVGLSKNRVLKSFPNFNYYFFIEDDVELLNPDIFDIHIKLSLQSGIQHFSLFPRERLCELREETKMNNFTIIHSMYGSAQVNFFTNEGLQKVGGFHDEFAKYKRFGHTEHTYRFVNVGLAKYPFNIISECIDDYFGWNDPISVTKIKVETTTNRLFTGEETLIRNKLSHYPLKTLSSYHLTNTLESKSIVIDRFAWLYKLRFQLQMNLLNNLRKIKRILHG